MCGTYNIESPRFVRVLWTGEKYRMVLFGTENGRIIQIQRLSGMDDWVKSLETTTSELVNAANYFYKECEAFRKICNQKTWADDWL